MSPPPHPPAHPPAVTDAAALRRGVRLLITVADNVRRGALPPRALDRMVAPQVTQTLLNEIDTTAGTGQSTVQTIQLQQPDATTTYFTGTAIRPDGTAAAYLGLISRTSDRDRWQITQCLPVTERTLGLPLQRDVGADPGAVAGFRAVIADGYLDAAVQLLGPIPPEDHAQRADWLEAATAIHTHGQTHQVGPTITADLDHTPTDPAATWTDARRSIDTYRASYDIDPTRYTARTTRLETLTPIEIDGPQRQTGHGLQADR